ncbi:MAG: CAP domain-containing protein, partial [Candidatus Altiarchaeota archaeon]
MESSKEKLKLGFTVTTPHPILVKGRVCLVNPLTLVLTFAIVFSLVNIVGIPMEYRLERITGSSVSPLPSAAAHETVELDESLARELDVQLGKVGGERDWLADSKKSIDYLNSIRQDYGRCRIVWDERAYYLAVYRSRDMFDRGYFDHVTPEGECAKDMKGMFGFYSYENVVENIGVLSRYKDGTPVDSTDSREALDGWMISRGHRYNLLYQNHVMGAVG